ncbi:hypothetical protein [Caballeronia sordidicola]|jgi:hypothetical protein|uniref:Uncharacterized protein n=1 Tax=Caballeronia sordidicola TaxID=196367 RepID=A0A226X868_CABSO|nr:hypothetical protein [Caballeronia sordidicola]OXC79180.1 hypothetical protein BSU04_08400 [Caballeronia sordidicola]
MSLHLRSVFFAAGLIVFGSLSQVSPSSAATSVDPRIYSNAPLTFKADRRIFSAVPAQAVDRRIFSPVDMPGDTSAAKRVQDYARLRHDL